MTALRATRRHTALLVGFCAIAFAIFLVMFDAGGGRLPGDGTRYSAQAVVPTAVALAPSAEVRTAGIRIGRVEEIATRGATAVLLLSLDERYAPVYRDARVRVRLKSVVGENYVELDPGSPSAGPVATGGVIPLENAEESTEVDEILSVLDRHRRRDLRAILTEAGGALRGRGAALNRLNGAVSDVTREATPVAAVLAAEREQFAALVADLGAVMRALGDRRDAIRVLAPRSRVAAEAVAAREQRLAAAVEELEPLLKQADRTTTLLGSVSTRAAPVVADLATGIAALGPAVRLLRPASRRGRALVGELDRLGPRGVSLLRRLASFTDTAGPTAPALDDLMRQALPLLGYLDPYARELGAFFSNQGAMASFRDVTGNMARFRLVFSRSWLAPMSEKQRRAVDALLDVGLLSKVRRQGSNAYPRPGRVGRAEPFSGTYPRLEALPPATR